MRIIAGEFRSRRLLSPPEDANTRPIPDRVKESLFSILRGQVEGAPVFDGFAGSGAIGLEALSRGASRCIFVERDRAMADIIRRNVDTLGVGDRAEVVVGDALGPGALARCPRPATIIMLDPPYDLIRDPIGWKRVAAQSAALVKCLADDGFLVLRTPWPAHHVEPSPLEKDTSAGRRRLHKQKGEPARAARPPAKDRWEEVWSLERPHTDEPAAADGEPAADSPGRQPARSRDVDLTIDGAAGPETHVYGTMALHFYMRPVPQKA